MNLAGEKNVIQVSQVDDVILINDFDKLKNLEPFKLLQERQTYFLK